MPLERYDIIAPLGSGGGGEVSLCRDKTSGGRVALKKITLKSGNDAAVAEKEAAALKALDHSHIVSLIDSFVDGRDYYLATNYIEGRLLSEIIAEAPPPLDTGDRYAMQILDALDHIHSHGIIHSDLKPENIIIDDGDNVHIIDFGIIRGASAELASDIKDIRGTLHYLSPEQAEGSTYDIRSDLFSFGVILYEMTTGRKPFIGDYDMAVLFAIMYEEPVPPERIHGGISPQLSKAILSLLAKSPDGRPASARHAAEQLRGAFSIIGQKDKSSDHSIALLRLTYPSSDDDSRLIAEGLREELYTRLKGIDEIDMISPIKIAQQEKYLVDGDAVRSHVGAYYYLTGSVRKLGGRVRIYLTLFKADDDTEAWSGKYDNPVSDLFDVIDLITERVVLELTSHLIQSPARNISTGATNRPEAYELYLLARSYYVKLTRKDTETARNLFHEALKLDSRYALAMVGIADCYCLEYMSYFSRSVDTIEQALTWASRALDLAPDLPEAYRSLGRIKQATNQYDDAIAYFLKAVTYRDDYYQAYRSLGWLTKDNYRYIDALNWVRKSLSINSTDLETIFLKGIIQFEHKESTQAINDFTRCLELRPDYGRAYFYMGMSYMQLAMVDKAIDCMTKAMDLGGDINAPYLLGFYYIVKNDFPMSIRYLNEACLVPPIAFIANCFLGMAYLFSNDHIMARQHFLSSVGMCENLLEEDPSFAIALATKVICLAFLDCDTECEEALIELIPYSTVDGSLAYDIARAYAILGKPCKANDFMQRAIETPEGPTQSEVALDPILSRFLMRSDNG